MQVKFFFQAQRMILVIFKCFEVRYKGSKSETTASLIFIAVAILGQAQQISFLLQVTEIGTQAPKTHVV